MSKRLRLSDYDFIPNSYCNDEYTQFPTGANEVKTHRFEDYNDNLAQKRTDVVFICAVEDEYNAFIEYLRFNSIFLEYSERIGGYFFQIKGELDFINCVVVKQRIAGMVACACLTCELSFLRPKLFVMPGICGGINGKVCQGDIIVASTTYDYGAGKYTREGTFVPAPNQYQLDNHLYRDASASQHNLKSILNTCPPNVLTVHDLNGNHFVKNSDTISVHIGTMASGAAVVNNENVVASMREDNRGVIAYDMEAYALAYATTNNPDTHIPWLVVKGVQDFPTTEDKNMYTKLAATVSIAFSIDIVKHHFNA